MEGWGSVTASLLEATGPGVAQRAADLPWEGPIRNKPAAQNQMDFYLVGTAWSEEWVKRRTVWSNLKRTYVI